MQFTKPSTCIFFSSLKDEKVELLPCFNSDHKIISPLQDADANRSLLLGAERDVIQCAWPSLFVPCAAC